MNLLVRRPVRVRDPAGGVVALCNSVSDSTQWESRQKVFIVSYALISVFYFTLTIHNSINIMRNNREIACYRAKYAIYLHAYHACIRLDPVYLRSV